MRRESLGTQYQEKLIQTALLIDQKLFGKTLQKKNFLKTFLEFFFNLFGVFLGLFLIRLPNIRIANFFTRLIALSHSGQKTKPLNPESLKNVEAAKGMLKKLQAEKQEKAAILILTSHPETIGPQSYLLGHLIYHASRISEIISPPSRFKFIQAIDSFALDTLHWTIGGTYAGLILSSHLAIDRIPDENSFLQKILFRRFSYWNAIFNIIRNLKNGTVICEALSGGVIHNSRILYTTKEFAQRIYFRSNRRETKRQFEQKIVSLITVEEPCATVTAKLSAEEEKKLSIVMRENGITDAEIAKELKEFKEELALKVPYRLRLFNILFRRICGKGTPLLLIPLAHTKTGDVVVNPALLVAQYDAKTKTVSVIEKNTPEKTKEENSADFVKRFIQSSFEQT